MTKKARRKATFDYWNQVRRVLWNKLSCKNKAAEIYSFAVPVIQYSVVVIRCKQKSLEETDIRTKTLMTMHGALHRKSGTAKLYTSMEKRGRSLHSVENVLRQE